MQRISAPNTVPALPAADDAGTPGFFSEGNPGGGVQATPVTDDFLNAIQEEMVETITAAGLALSPGDLTQLRQAVQFFSDQASARASAGLLRGRLQYNGLSSVRIDRAYDGKILSEIKGTVVEKNDASLVLDLTADLFEGVEASSTWYYVYLENNAGTLVPRLSATAPNALTLYHPTQDYRCVGAFYNAADGNVFRFHPWGDAHGGTLFGQQYEAASDPSFELSPGTSSGPSYIALDLAGRLPSIAREVVILVVAAADSSTWHYGPESLVGTTTPAVRKISASTNGVSSAVFANASFSIPIENPAAPRIAWWRASGNQLTDHRIHVLGWR